MTASRICDRGDDQAGDGASQPAQRGVVLVARSRPLRPGRYDESGHGKRDDEDKFADPAFVQVAGHHREGKHQVSGNDKPDEPAAPAQRRDGQHRGQGDPGDRERAEVHLGHQQRFEERPAGAAHPTRSSARPEHEQQGDSGEEQHAESLGMHRLVREDVEGGESAAHPDQPKCQVSGQAVGDESEEEELKTQTKTTIVRLASVVTAFPATANRPPKSS